MGALGRCPTCSGAVSTTAVACPHCGEREFSSYGSYESRCGVCAGSGRNLFGFNCSRCGGTGTATYKGDIDQR